MPLKSNVMKIVAADAAGHGGLKGLFKRLKRKRVKVLRHGGLYARNVGLG